MTRGYAQSLLSNLIFGGREIGRVFGFAFNFIVSTWHLYFPIGDFEWKCYNSGRGAGPNLTSKGVKSLGDRD